MTIIYPEATPSQGNIKLKAVLAITNTAAPSLATEINAATSLDLSMFVRDWNPDITSNTGTAAPRLGTRLQLPQEGQTQLSAVEIRYVYDPQAADTTNENKAKSMLTQGLVFYIVVRKGKDAQNVAFAASQQVEVWKFRAGRQNRTRSGDDEFSEFEISQMLFPTLVPTETSVIAA